MNLKNQVQKMDQLVSKGAIVSAVRTFFGETAITSDYNNVTTNGKDQMIVKMESFFGTIAKVNSIIHHRTITDQNVSASEFTFDFDMTDGSKILWHEIIRRVWNDEGEVINEKYFKT